MSQTSTLFTVGTLLRHAKDAGAPVRVLVEGSWLDGTPVGADGLGVILDAEDSQVLVRLDAITAVVFSRSHLDRESPADADGQAWEGQAASRPAVAMGAGASAG